MSSSASQEAGGASQAYIDISSKMESHVQNEPAALCSTPLNPVPEEAPPSEKR